MATQLPLSVEEAERDERVGRVFADMRATRRSDYINSFWRSLARQPAMLESTWAQVKAVMATPGALDPLTRELIYIAVSTANGCGFCIHSHTAAAREKGMTDAQHAELLAVIGLAAQTNALATGLQLEADDRYQAR